MFFLGFVDIFKDVVYFYIDLNRYIIESKKKNFWKYMILRIMFNNYL